MNQLKVIEHDNKRVLTTQQLAEAYETDTQKIAQNYHNNKKRYLAGKHFYKIEGDELKKHIENFEVQNPNMIRTLYLWTEKGALLHAKSLNTDKAWEVYDQLVETYFKAREMFVAPKNYVEALEAALTLAKQIEEQKPAVAFFQTCQSSEDSVLIRALAKLASKGGKTIGQNNLFRELRKWGLLNSQNEPYQRYIDCGYFEVIERPIHTSEGTLLKFTTKVLPKGQAYIINRLGV